MTEQLKTIGYECGVRMREDAYEERQARRRQGLGLGQGMTDRQRIQADHEARAEDELKGSSRISRPETMSLTVPQLELADMFVTTFARSPRSVAS